MHRGRYRALRALVPLAQPRSRHLVIGVRKRKFHSPAPGGRVSVRSLNVCCVSGADTHGGTGFSRAIIARMDAPDPN
jgi:hypothetical protein